MDYAEPPPLPVLDFAADELTTLTEMLDYYRTVLLHRGWILDAGQMATRMADHPSELTMGGLFLHMALVEDQWYTVRFLGEPEPEPWASAPFDEDWDWEFHVAAQWEPSQILDQFQESVDRSRRVIAEAESLETLTVKEHAERGHWNLRWIMVHMIEEYARHCGHADLLREAIDGVTNDWR